MKTNIPLRGAAAPELLLEIRFPAVVDRLSLVRNTVRAAAHKCGFEEPALQDIVLAVDEACQNIIVHGYGDTECGDIVLGIYRQIDAIRFHLRDFAPDVEAEELVPRDLDDIRPGGLGIHFINQTMDAAVYQTVPGEPGNVLEMIKRTDNYA